MGELHLSSTRSLSTLINLIKVIPLFLLICSMQFAPLGWKNVACVVVHLIADPNSNLESLLSKMDALKEHSEQARRLSHLPRRVQQAVAAILAAREECDVYTEEYAPHTRRRSSVTDDLFRELHVYLGGTVNSTMKQQTRRNACLQAANELSDARDRTMAKTIIATINYIVVVVVAFLHIYDGDFNNRTGHSIAAAMLYSWLIPTINLSTLVGTFSNKRSAEDVLGRLQEAFTRIEMQVDLSGKSSTSPTKPPHISRFTSTQTPMSDLSIHAALPYSGGNPTFRPHQSTWGLTTRTNRLLAQLPALISTLSAAVISYTSPTRGLGCRSVQHLSMYASWILSYLLTSLIRRTTPSARLQWKYILIKDTLILPFQLSGLFAGFIGWFNSCFCWSAVFSLGRSRAYVVVVEMRGMIMALARREWPALTGLALGFQLLLFAGVWWWYRDGVEVFVVEEADRVEGRHCGVGVVVWGMKGLAGDL
jgi:hypothetical protein